MPGLFAAELDLLVLFRDFDVGGFHVALAEDVGILVDEHHVLLRDAGSEVSVVLAVPFRAGGELRVAGEEVFLAVKLRLAIDYTLAEFGKRIVDGKAKLNSKKDLLACYAEFTPGAKWNGQNYTDLGTGVTKKNMMLIYQDTYILGKGYMKATDVKVPEKYQKIKFSGK